MRTIHRVSQQEWRGNFSMSTDWLHIRPPKTLLPGPRKNGGCRIGLWKVNFCKRSGFTLSVFTIDTTGCLPIILVQNRVLWLSAHLLHQPVPKKDCFLHLFLDFYDCEGKFLPFYSCILIVQMMSFIVTFSIYTLHTQSYPQLQRVSQRMVCKMFLNSSLRYYVSVSWITYK